MTMQWSKGLTASVMALALAVAGAQTTVKSSSTASTFTTTATGGGQSGTSPIVKDDLFAGTEIFAKGASDVTEITMDPSTLGMVGGKSKARASNMVLNVVRTYEYDKPGMYRIEDVEAFRNKLNTGEWHCSVHTRSLKTGESTDICNKQRSDDLSESAIITVEPKELTFIHKIVRKTGEGVGGTSGLEMPFLYGMPGHGSLAMLDPEAFADMQMAKARIMGMNLPALEAQIGPAMSQFKKLDSKKMQKQMEDAIKSLKDAQKPELSSPKQPE
jgi:hypothetical protein